MYQTEDHTFAICAYKESPYLRECVSSLVNQTEKSQIIVCTSTPNAYINEVCQEFELTLHISSKKSGIARDWNFAMACAKTPLVTIAHQDDVYKPTYLESALFHLNGAENPLLFFSGYSELRDGAECVSNTLLNVKRLMLKPLENKKRSSSVRARRTILAFGDPIGCPSITYVTPKLSLPLFMEDYFGSLDWQMLEEVSKLQGDFVYDPSVQMSHRIHGGSETSSLIECNLRSEEDYDMFCKFWPAPIARFLSKAYSLSQKSNG